MIAAVTILLLFQLAGEIIVRTLQLPLPGPVAGMLLLFAALLLRDSLAPRLEETTQFILQNLTLLYVPAAVGVMVHLGLLLREGVAMGVTLIAGLLLTLIVTAWTMNLLLILARATARRKG